MHLKFGFYAGVLRSLGEDSRMDTFVGIDCKTELLFYVLAISSTAKAFDLLARRIHRAITSSRETDFALD